MLASQSVTEFKPTKLAILSYYFKFGILAVTLGTGISAFLGMYSSVQSWLIHIVSYLTGWMIPVVVLLPSIQNLHTITVSEKDITGPAGKLFWQRTAFALEQLDKIKTAQPSISQKIFGYRYIWSADNQRILVNLHVFQKSQLQEAFQRIGSTESLLV